jgi:hypothetical protein
MAKVTSGQVGEYLKIGLYMAGAFIAYKAIKGLAETFGIIKTKEESGLETATEQASQSSTEASSTNPLLSFSPLYSNALVVAYKKKYPSKVWDVSKQEKIDRPKFLELAKDILDAKGYFNDDEDKLYNVFKTIQTQFQLSLLSRVFSTYYKKDLLEYLKSILNADEIAPILNQVKNYPQYFK